MTTETKDKDVQPASGHSHSQKVKVGQTTVNVSLDEPHKSDDQLEKERHEQAEAAQEAERKREIERAKVAVQEAKTRLEAAEADLAKLEGKGKSRFSTRGGASTLPPGTDLREHQIAHGQAPIEPGKEKPVELDDAKAAKTNRGRGLGG